MIYVPMGVVKGAFDWVGLDVTVEGNTFRVTKGRIGREENPLINEDGKIRGGWYVKETTHTMSPDIATVDVVVKEDKTYLMFRSDDPDEVCPAEYDILITLAWRKGGLWYSVKPRRDARYEEAPRQG